MSTQSLVSFRAGPGAIAHVRQHGLAPADIACIPAAAGGPKGLALLPLDRLLYREWLQAPGLSIELMGASVGAWRMAALAQPDPPFHLYHPRWPFYTRTRSLPPNRIIRSEIYDSLVVEGTDLSGARISDSIIGVRGIVREGMTRTCLTVYCAAV